MKIKLLIVYVILFTVFKIDFAKSENRWTLTDTLRCWLYDSYTTDFFGDGLQDIQTVNKKDIIIQAIVYGSYPRLFISNDTGKTWNVRLEEEPIGKSATGGKQNNFISYPMAYPNEKLIILTGDSGYYWRSVDNGVTFKRMQIENKLVGAMYFWDEKKGIFVQQYNSRLDSNNIFTFDQIFQKTTDGGLTWNQFNGPNYIHKKVGTYFQTFENGILYSIEIGRYIYLDSTAGCVRGAVYPDSADWVYKSTDYGETWTSYKGINIVFEENLRYFFLTENIWFTYGGSYISTLPDTNSSIIRKTTDAGRTWHYVLDTIYIDLWGSSQIRDISFSDSLNGIATAYTTIWKTSDGGETWQTDTSFHPTSSSQLIEHILMIDKHTAIGIPDVWGYVYRWTEDYEVSVNEHNERNSAAIIFPNPARDYIYINSAFIEGAGGVWQYQIYDILGNCVQSGTTESKTININQLSAGFYTVRFFNAGKQVVEKMIKE